MNCTKGAWNYICCKCPAPEEVFSSTTRRFSSLFYSHRLSSCPDDVIGREENGCSENADQGSDISSTTRRFSSLFYSLHPNSYPDDGTTCNDVNASSNAGGVQAFNQNVGCENEGSESENADQDVEGNNSEAAPENGCDNEIARVTA